jgi:hypothetical protein
MNVSGAFAIGFLTALLARRVIKPLFEGVRASANPAYQGNERCVDPEEAYVTSRAYAPLFPGFSGVFMENTRNSYDCA